MIRVMTAQQSILQHRRMTQTQPAKRVSRWTLLALIAAALFAGFAAWQSGILNSAPDDLPTPFPAPGTSWADHLIAGDRNIAEYRARATHQGDDWLSPSAEAAALLNRAVMTGRWQDYAAAEAALRVAMARAPGPETRPYPLAARLALALHRNAQVEPALQAARADLEFSQPMAQADATMMRGDVALYRGDWRTAATLYARAASMGGSNAVTFRQAFLTERTGDADAARQLWINAANGEGRPSRRTLSFAAMRLGNLELARGRWDDAAQWYARADTLLPGDWHIAALRLQMRALSGDLAGATQGMTRLATAHDLPELWDALAAWRRATGDNEGAKAALARAQAGWTAWQAQFPEAAAAHAAEHALIAGEREDALRFAQAAYDSRPYGDTATLLATALTANGKVDDALALVRRTQASGWHSTELDRLAFELAALAGDAPAAERARADALTRNPRAFDPAMTLIRFGLH